MITNFLLAAFNVFFAALLFGQWMNRRQPLLFFWILAFIFTGIAAGFGGVYHGFLEQKNVAVVLHLCWKGAIYAIALASLCMLIGSILGSLSYPYDQWLLILAVLQFSLFAGWMMRHEEYRYVIYDYAGAMLLVAVLQIIDLVTKPWMKGPGWILGGIGISFAAAFLQQAKVGVQPLLDHNDLYHLIQIAGMAFLYQGVVQRIQSF
jgi:hypothetical protein